MKKLFDTKVIFNDEKKIEKKLSLEIRRLIKGY